MKRLPDTKPFKCHRCHRMTDELRFCRQCKALVCFKCLLKESGQLVYAQGGWLCNKCKESK